MRASIAVLCLILLAACGRQPCDEGSGGGPTVRLDVALGSCNHRPTAEILAKNVVARGERVAIDGSGSSDPDSDALSFEWSLAGAPGGSSAKLSDTGGAHPVLAVDIAGTYVVRLVVNDAERASLPAERSIVAVNLAPTADAGPDVRVRLGENAVLDGTRSADPEADLLRYAWSITTRPRGSLASLDDPSVAMPSFVPDVRGVFEATLIVNDGVTNSAPDTVQIYAGVSGSAPIADAGPDQSAAEGDLVALDGSRSRDPDQDPLTYLWTVVSAPAGASPQLSTRTDPRVTFVPQRRGAYTFRLVVNDGYFESPPDEVTIEVGLSSSPSSVFDPAGIYIDGTLYPGASGWGLFCRIDAMQTYVAGFDLHSMPGLGRIRPTDGRLIYPHFDGGTSSSDLRVFAADALSTDSRGDWTYPSDPVADDEVVSTPACPSKVDDFLIHPSTGEVLYTCLRAGDVNWYDQSGAVISLCPDHADFPIAIGYDGSVFCWQGVRDMNGVRHELTVTQGGPYAVRARPQGGFWVAVEEQGRVRRWVVDPSGNELLDQDFGPPPVGYQMTFVGTSGHMVLDGRGNVYRPVSRPGETTDIIAAFTDASAATIVYDESLGWDCQMHGAQMVTGP